MIARTYLFQFFFFFFFLYYIIVPLAVELIKLKNFSIALNKVDFFRSHKLFVTLSSVAIASKWDEPEKIKVFIVSTVGRKVLQSRKGERHNCTVWCNTGCSRKGETHYVQLPRRNTVTRNLGYLKSFNV